MVFVAFGPAAEGEGRAQSGGGGCRHITRSAIHVKYPLDALGVLGLTG